MRQGFPFVRFGDISKLTALQDDCSWVEDLHDLGHDGLEEAVERGVIGAVAHWYVDRVELAMALPHIPYVPRSRKEVVPVLVEAHSKHPTQDHEPE